MTAFFFGCTFDTRTSCFHWNMCGYTKFTCSFALRFQMITITLCAWRVYHFCHLARVMGVEINWCNGNSYSHIILHVHAEQGKVLYNCIFYAACFLHWLCWTLNPESSIGRQTDGVIWQDGQKASRHYIRYTRIVEECPTHEWYQKLYSDNNAVAM